MAKRKRKMTPYLATGLAEGFEEGNEEEVIAAWQYLVDTRMAWRLQGSFGRTASSLLEQGIIKYPKKKTTDFYGNPIPTRNDVAKKMRRIVLG
jgi:hypothetical protein